MKVKSIWKLFAISVTFVMCLTCVMPCIGADNSTLGDLASLGVTTSFGVQTENDTIASGTYDAIAGYGLSLTNMSGATMGELVFHVEADDVGEVSLEEYAERTETSVTWTFPPEFDLDEGDWLWTGYKTSCTDTRDISMSLSRDIDKAVFNSDGYQHAEFSVTFDNTDFLSTELPSAYVQIIADEYNQVEEVDASFLVDTFSTNILYSNILTKNEHKIYLRIFKPELEEIEPGVEYNFSVDVEVRLTGSETPPIVYKPFFSVGVVEGATAYAIATGKEFVWPSELLPEHMHYASVSTNVSNTWYSGPPTKIIESTLSEISNPIVWDPWAYDEDDSNYIEIGELLCAINDYIDGDITISQLLEIINLYISHTPKPALSWGDVNDWLYQLQDLDLDAIGNSKYDLVVMDYSSDGTAAGEHTPAEIAALKNSPGGPKLVLAYMSIGEAEDYRYYWRSDWEPGNPIWLDAENPDWPGNYKVKYWYPEWQNIIFGYLDKIIAAGFDGVYLDLVDAYEYYAETRPTAEQEMVDFVVAISDYTHVSKNKANFGIFPQNAAEVEAHPGYLAAVTGIGQEETYYGYDGVDGEPTPPEVTSEIESHLDKFVAAGKLALTVDYTTQQEQIDDAYQRAKDKGYIPFCTVQGLDQLTINPGHEPD